uniref:Macaca fascicularis brain cDNA, clone: QflA-22667 n=1 Tax=Macaca fascicularis TaxID=9541 RepID=I7GIU4_MACFA|nr:unnamed protein product [Macaca fascicularis]
MNAFKQLYMFRSLKLLFFTGAQVVWPLEGLLRIDF